MPNETLTSQAFQAAATMIHAVELRRPSSRCVNSEPEGLAEPSIEAPTEGSTDARE